MDVPGERYDLRDDHYYLSPHNFLALHDTYQGEGPKVYVGEYACTEDVGKGNLLGAIGESAFLCGLENCCDRVRMASYAPLFCHENDQRWSVNLIHFDRRHTFALPSYYVQKLFAEHPVDRVVANTHTVRKGELTTLVITTGVSGKDLIIKAANFGPEPTVAQFACDAIAPGICPVWTVSGEKETDTNSFLYPQNITDVQTSAPSDNGTITQEFAPWSFTVLRVPMK